VNEPKDKYGRNIEHCDVLKVFHFIGSRRKKYYMYKLAVKHSDGRMYGCHLLSGRIGRDYFLGGDLFNSDDYEIVQSKNYKKLDTRVSRPKE
jgi:hypothetical protein